MAITPPINEGDNKTPNDQFTVFYAWQCDSPHCDNRNFIESAIAMALKAIQMASRIQASPRLDKDTKGITGIPDIANTILEKIRACDLIVADVSFIGKSEAGGKDEKPLPNPNVMIELGYALSELSWERIILVLNTTTGTPDKLPFDLRNRRWPFEYVLTSATAEADRLILKKSLSKQLQGAIEAIANLPPRRKRGTVAQRLDALETMVSTLSGSVAQATAITNLLSRLQMVPSVDTYQTGDRRSACEEQLQELISRINAGQSHGVKFQEGMFVMSILPTSARNPVQIFDGKNEQTLNLGLKPMAAFGWDTRRYGSRLVTTSGVIDGIIDAATEITLDGCINATSHNIIAISPQLWAYANQKAPANTICIPGVAYEKEVIEAVAGYLKVLKVLETKGPWFVRFAIINIKRTVLYANPSFMFNGRAFEGGEIRLPLVEIPDSIDLENKQTVARALRPAFDYIWREHNYPRSLNYAASGDWVGQ